MIGFKKIFFLGASSSFLAFVVSVIYTEAYYSRLVDFSEAMSWSSMFSNFLLIGISACFIYLGLNRLLKNQKWTDFVFNLMFSAFSLIMVFMVLKADDPQFKNEDAQLLIDYYKGFVMPVLFFPALSWFSLKPLFFK